MFHNHHRENAELFLQRVFGLITQKTDPELINAILKNLHLDSFISTDQDFNSFLQQLTTQPMDASPLLQKVREDILNNEPLCHFIALLQSNQLISDAELQSCQQSLQLHVNLLFLIEVITVMTANSNVLAGDIYEHIIKRRNHTHTGSPLHNFMLGAPRDAGAFERFKMISIEPAMLTAVFHRMTSSAEETSETVDEFIEKYKLSGWNASAITPASLQDKGTHVIAPMALNIMEAAWSDATSSVSGGRENAEAGFGLIGVMEFKQYISRYAEVSTVLPEGAHITASGDYSIIAGLKINNSEKKIAQFFIDRAWRDLYNAWNLRFCVANLSTTFLQVKLLCPSVFAAMPENFKETRLIALFLMCNLYVNEEVAKNNFFACDARFAQAEKIMHEWGRINDEYAAAFIRSSSPGLSYSPSELYHLAFGDYPTLSFMQGLYSFVRQSYNFRLFCTEPTSRIGAKTQHMFQLFYRVPGRGVVCEESESFDPVP